jgi:hypothetical protein
MCELFPKPKVNEAIASVITCMMDRVMEKVLREDPFIIEDHRAKKPLYAALVPDEIFKGSHFERRFVTPFGSVWEKLGHVVGDAGRGHAELSKTIRGNIKQGRLVRIQEVLNKLEHSAEGEKKVKPNWNEEIKYILAGEGEIIPSYVICDLYVEDVKTHEKLAFELKAPLPNSDQTKVSKEKIFKLYAMENSPVTNAYYCLPYNPYGKKEDYAWSFPKRWFDMCNDPCVLIGEEFWDTLGGPGTYANFIKVVTELGRKYHEQIYKEYLGLVMPEDYKYFSL